MISGEKLKECRLNKGLSQEKVAELLGVSKQAVSKWESSQTAPSTDNLIALSGIYDVSLDELAGNTVSFNPKENKILQRNLTGIAIIAQTAYLNVAMKPMEDDVSGTTYWILFAFKWVPLLLASIWMTHNLKYEKNIVQYRKNVKIELAYCMLQTVVALAAYYTTWYSLGTLLLIINCIVYILVINPKYMNRKIAKTKEERQKEKAEKR